MLTVNRDKSHAIEVETREQTESVKWWEERRLRITASKFGEVVTRKKQNCEKFVERLQCTTAIDAKKLPTSLKCYYRPTASLQLNNKRNTKYNITVT